MQSAEHPAGVGSRGVAEDGLACGDAFEQSAQRRSGAYEILELDVVYVREVVVGIDRVDESQPAQRRAVLGPEATPQRVDVVRWDADAALEILVDALIDP